MTGKVLLYFKLICFEKLQKYKILCRDMRFLRNWQITFKKFYHRAARTW